MWVMEFHSTNSGWVPYFDHAYRSLNAAMMKLQNCAADERRMKIIGLPLRIRNTDTNDIIMGDIL